MAQLEHESKKFYEFWEPDFEYFEHLAFSCAQIVENHVCGQDSSEN